jgi:multidrug efflux pump subunit AcrB
MTPFRIVFFFVFISLAALATLPYLPVDFIPQEKGNSFQVQFSYPSAPPLVVEQEVTAPLENILSQLTQISEITSVSNYGSGYIQLEFQPETDMAFKELEIYTLLRQAKSRLPYELASLSVSRSSADDDEKKPLLIYEFLYPPEESLPANEWLTSQLIPAFNRFGDIEEVQLSGQKQYAWEILFDEGRLQKLGLNPQKIRARLQEVIGRQELGVIHVNQQLRSLRYDQQFTSSEDLLDISLEAGLQLSDFASVNLVEDRVRTYKRINGKNAIFLSLIPYENINRLELASTIRENLSRGQFLDFPPGYELQLNYDDTEYLSRELEKTWIRAGLSIGILLILILIVSRNLRYLFTLFSSIAVSYCLTIGLAWLLDISIHLYSLAAITIAMGIIIDNSIILLDHLRKYGNLKILPAQLAASLTTIASMAVIFLLPTEYRGGLEDFAAMIVLSLMVSFFVSWWFSPALQTLVGGGKARADSRRRLMARWKARLQLLYFAVLTRMARRKWLVVVACVLAFGLPVFMLPTEWEGQEWYNKTIGSDYYQEELRPIVNKALGGSMRLFYLYVYESSVYRTPEKTRLYVNARLPYGHTLQQMNDIMVEVEAYLSQFQEVDKYISQVYSGRFARVTIEFKEQYESGVFPYMLKNRLIQRSLDWGGVDWSVYGVGRGFSNASGDQLPSFFVKMTGYNYDDLAIHAQSMAEKLLRHKRIQEVDTEGQLSWRQSSFTTYYFQPGIDLFSEHYLRLRSSLISKARQERPSLYLPYNEQYYPVYLTGSESTDFSLYRAQYEGTEDVPGLMNFGTLERKKSLDAVHKQERQYIRGVRFDYYGSYRFGKKYLDEVIEEMRAELPAGYEVEHSSWSWGSKEKNAQNKIILLLLVILFFIASIHLESLKRAFFVIFIVPFSFVGLFLAFGWLDFSFDQGGYAAFLMISGLSVNAVLYLLSDIHQLKKKYAANMAVRKAVLGKAWPVTLTIISTCLGLVPFLIHGEQEVFWFSFAVGTIGGLLFSLVLFFLVIPVWEMQGKR